MGTQRTYTTEFKEEVVALAEEKTAKEAAREKNVPEDTVYMWVAKAKQGNLNGSNASSKSKAGKTSNAVDEQLKEAKKKIKMLEQENAQLKKERDILEGATTFFATRQKEWGKR